MRITKFAIPEILFGRGSVTHIGPCAKALGGEIIFLVSDPGIEQAGWLAQVKKNLHGVGLSCVDFCQVTPNPRDYQVQEGAALYNEVKADIIVALGGGSPMDVAKGIGIVVSNGGRINDYEGANRVERPLPPMIFLPTTAGSGSDLSQFCIITDEKRKLKMSIISRSLIPHISIIDPDFLSSKPTALIVDSSIDALAHAIESFISLATSPFTETQARLALKLWHENVDDARINRSPAALENLSLASAAAGMSFSNASLGAGHALAHALGGRFDLFHGMMHSILLPAVLRFNRSHCAKKVEEILCTLFPGGAFATDAQQLHGIDLLRARFADMGVPVNLRSVLAKKNSLLELCEAAVNDTCMLTNPKPASVQDLLDICTEAW